MGGHGLQSVILPSIARQSLRGMRRHATTHGTLAIDRGAKKAIKRLVSSEVSNCSVLSRRVYVWQGSCGDK